MNMISTGAFQTEMAASETQETLVRKLVSSWEKKNAKVARASGVSLMALSLAACGSDDDTSTSTSTSTSTDTTTVVAANQSFIGTTGIDVMTGGAGDDTFFTIATGTTASAQPGDSFTGGAGSDILAITATGAAAATVAGVTIDGIETVRVSDTNTGGTTINMAGTTGVTTLMAFGSANAGATTSFINVGGLADIELSNTSSTGAVTVTYTAAAIAGANTQTITASTAGSTGLVTVANVETFNITASGSSTVNLVGADAETINVTATDATTIGLVSATNDEITTVTGAGSAGAITMTVDYDLTELSVTGGDGADVFDTTSVTISTNDSLDGGAGIDTLLYQDDATGAIASATIAADAATITNVEQIELQADTAGGMTIDMDSFEGIDTVILDDNTGVTFTLNDLSATDAANISVQASAGNTTDVELDMKTGTGTTDSATITATGVTGGAALTVGDANGNIESVSVSVAGDANQTLTFDNGDFAGSTAANGSITVSGGSAGRTMTIAQTTSNIVAETFDFSGVASNVTTTMGTVNATVTGGIGNDTVDFAATFSSADSFDGGAGTDTIVIAPGTSIAAPGTLTNVEKIELAASASVTVGSTGISGVTELVLSNAAGLDGNVVTMNGLTGVTTITHDVADVAAADGADDANGVTITSGYVGTADALTLAIDNAGTNAGATVMGAVTVNGVEDMTVTVTGGTDNDTATVGGISSNTMNTLTVTSSGFTENAVNIALGSIATGDDTMISVDFSGANTGVSATLADMGAASTITGSAYADTIILTGSTGDDLVMNTGNGNDQITMSSGVDRVTLTTGTGDADIFFATGDGHTITLGTGANVLDFDLAGAPAETTGVTVTGFTANDDIRPDAAADTAVNIISAQTAALNSNLFSADTAVFTLNASVADALISGNDAATAVADFTDVANNGDVEILLELLYGGNAGGGTGMIVLNDGTNSYVYAATIDANEEITALNLVATINSYIVNGATDIVL
jgi:hypothetical protein